MMTYKNLYTAAFSQVDITPEYQVELIGSNRGDNRSQGVLHRLYAQVLLFRSNKDTFCLIAIDNLGLTTQLGNDLRGKVARLLGTTNSHVMLCFSHTHSAPEPSSFALNGELYFKQMSELIVECAGQAVKNLVPCKAGWAITDTDIVSNRREGCTVADRRLGALKIINAISGEPITALFRITAHANVLMRDNSLISSDYFGVAREKLQSYVSSPVMLIQGAAGNIKPIGTDKINGGKFSDLDKIANILADSAKELHFVMQDINDLQMFSQDIVFNSDVPSETEAKRIAAEGKKTCGIDGSNWLLECEKLRQSGINEQSQHGEVQFFKLNNGCICGVAEEIFCEISLDVLDKTQNPLVFLNGYTNGCTGYLPSKEEWKKGGYETLYSYLQYYQFHGHVMPYRADTAERLSDLTAEAWESLNSGYRC